jgi:hypothetical protein
MRRQRAGIRFIAPLAFTIAGSVICSSTPAQTNDSKDPAAVSGHNRFVATTKLQSGARLLFQSQWGIDNIHVRKTASGALIRLSYRVADVNKAKVLNDEKAKAYLIDQKTGAALQIPTMANIGQLRQTAPPQAGLEYWMVFSNKGNRVKPGDRVSLVVGNIWINGLVVE